MSYKQLDRSMTNYPNYSFILRKNSILKTPCTIRIMFKIDMRVSRYNDRQSRGISEAGGFTPAGKSFRVWCACARCGCKVGMHPESHAPDFPFSLVPRKLFPLLVRSCVFLLPCEIVCSLCQGKNEAIE